MVVIITVNSIMVFTKQLSAEGFLANLFFTSNFVIFQKILAAHQKNVPKIFRKSTKIILVVILVKLPAFTEAATSGVL